MLGSDRGSDDIGYLRRQAERCARLAGTMNDRRAREELERMAGEFETLVGRAGSDEPVSGRLTARSTRALDTQTTCNDRASAAAQGPDG